MAGEKNRFVFVVCGARVHIDTLHFSLAALKQFTQFEILVVTDPSKNEIPVVHQQVINIATPAHFDNHQSSIYLKTGLHKFLPKGFTYCYLDTDVIALSPEVNEIFNHKSGHITFAGDHCSMAQFSPHAVNCGCAEQNKTDRLEIHTLLQKFGYNPRVTSSVLLQKQKQLKQRLELIKHNKSELLVSAIRYLFSPSVFKLDNDFSYHRAKNYWTDADGNPILYEVPTSVIKQIEKNTLWRWNKRKRRWISPHGKDIELLACEHLEEAINDKFKLAVIDHWQHWNGGVFVFDDEADAFMETWHQYTLAIFNDPYWKTRDQGTLIATAWKLGLHNAPVLPKKFNFIAYFYNPALMLSEDKKSISDDAMKTQYNPAFIHVFEQFGAGDWDMWNWIETKLKRN